MAFVALIAPRPGGPVVEPMFLDNCTRWELGGSHCLLWLGILDINNVGIENPILLSLTSSHNTIPSQSSVHRGAENTALHTRVDETQA
jgi:hypothetical protein